MMIPEILETEEEGGVHLADTQSSYSMEMSFDLNGGDPNSYKDLVYDLPYHYENSQYIEIVYEFTNISNIQICENLASGVHIIDFDRDGQEDDMFEFIKNDIGSDVKFYKDARGEDGVYSLSSENLVFETDMYTLKECKSVLNVNEDNMPGTLDTPSSLWIPVLLAVAIGGFGLFARRI